MEDELRMKRTKKNLYGIAKDQCKMGLSMTLIFVLYLTWDDFANIINFLSPIIIVILIFYFLIYLMGIIILTRETRQSTQK